MINNSHKIINGKELSDEIIFTLKEKVSKLERKPGLAVILVGDNPASKTYVRNKERRANELGIISTTINIKPVDPSHPIEKHLPSTESKILNEINRLNNLEECDGILVQLPLPKDVSEERVLRAIKPEKDVDGFHPTNMGNLWLGNPGLVPSTPAGIIEMLKSKEIPIEGQHAVIVGRSNIVGKPIAQMLLNLNATVTIVHSKTKNLEHFTKQADILIVAIGKPELISSKHVKSNAVIIDVGINHNENNKLVGDVNFNDVIDKVKYISPVPKGVGPMTVAMLMKQTIDQSERNQRK